MRCAVEEGEGGGGGGGGGGVDVKIPELTTNPSAAQGYFRTIILCHNQTRISKLFSYT